MQVELLNLKNDNDKLLQLLKETADYQDLEDTAIIKKAKTLSN